MNNIISYLPEWNHFVGAFFAFMIPYTISQIAKWLRQLSKFS